MTKIAKPPFDTSSYDIRNIHRQEKPSGSGYWWLKVQRNGKKMSKTFFDTLYGGAKPALIAAILEREQFINENPKLPFLQGTTKANSTSVSGVSYSPTTGSKGAFYATWREPDTGKAICKKFYIASNGFYEALKKAIDARRSWEESVRARIENGEQLGEPKIAEMPFHSELHYTDRLQKALKMLEGEFDS